MKNREFGIALAVLAIGASASTAAGQVHSPTKVRPEVQGYALIGGAAVDFDPINRSLGAQGFGDVAGEMLSIGGGGHITLGRWILGGEGFGLLPRESETAGATWRARIAGGGGMANIGYKVVRRGGTSVYPLVGIGAGAITLQMTGRGSPTFDDVMTNPGRGSSLHRVVMLLQPAIGLDHFIPVANVENMKAGVVIGVRAGYTFTPVTSSWYLDDMKLPGGADQGMKGPFVRIALGGGSRPLAGSAVARTGR